jgi:hypothetical protein
MSAIKCAHCKGHHDTIAQVRLCAHRHAYGHPFEVVKSTDTCEHGMSLDLCAGPQHYPNDDMAPMATMSDAHSEWHRNTGVPMGHAGCPQDACDGPYHDDEDCPECGGNGTVEVNHTYNRDPQCGETVVCPTCQGTGHPVEVTS